MRLDISMLQRDVEDLRAVIEANTKQMQELVQAWQTATGFVSFVKWLAGFVTACAIVFAAFKGQTLSPTK